MGDVIRVVRVPKDALLVELPIDLDLVKFVHALANAGFKMVSTGTEISGAMRVVRSDVPQEPLPTLLPAPK